MFKDFLNKITTHHSKNLPFVVYRKPNEPKVNALFQNDDALYHVIDFKESGFVFAPFDTQKDIVLLQGDERFEATPNSLKTSAKEPITSKVDLNQKEFHVNLIKNGLHRIRRSELQKIVLSRKEEVDCAMAPLALFQELLARYDNAFCYLWYHPKIGTWLGATPEILLKGVNEQMTTMSLAGTQVYANDLDPIWGTKELEEQQLVTNFISDAIKDKVTHLRISERETVRAGKLLHLRTKLTARYDKDRLNDIILALHPTPAVCGLPMAPSKDFILNNENYDREYYTGYLGELNLKVETSRSSQRKNQENQVYKSINTATTFFVNLRCMQLKDNKAFIYVGGGVTKDSDPYMEWEETVAKTNTMLRVLTTE